MVDKKIQVQFADNGWISFKIPSSSRDEYQYVSWDEDNGWSCTCEHYHYRKQYCKHMEEAKQFLRILNDNVQNCNYAFSSKSV